MSNESGYASNWRGRNGAVRSLARARRPGCVPNPRTPSFAPSSYDGSSVQHERDARSSGDIDRHRQSGCR